MLEEFVSWMFPGDLLSKRKESQHCCGKKSFPQNHPQQIKSQISHSGILLRLVISEVIALSANSCGLAVVFPSFYRFAGLHGQLHVLKYYTAKGSTQSCPVLDWG